MKKKNISVLVIYIVLIILVTLVSITLFKIVNKTNNTVFSASEEKKQELKNIIEKKEIMSKKFYIVSKYPSLNEKIKSYLNQIKLDYYLTDSFSLEKAKDYDIIVFVKSFNSLELSNYFINDSTNEPDYYNVLYNIGIVKRYNLDINDKVYEENGEYKSEILSSVDLSNTDPYIEFESSLSYNNKYFGIVFYNKGDGDLMTFYDSSGSKIFSVSVKSGYIYFNSVNTGLGPIKPLSGISVKFENGNIIICYGKQCYKTTASGLNSVKKIVFGEGSSDNNIYYFIYIPNYKDIEDIKTVIDRNEGGFLFDFTDRSKYSGNKLYDENSIMYIDNINSLSIVNDYAPSFFTPMEGYNVKLDGTGKIGYLDTIPVVILEGVKQIFYYKNQMKTNRPDYYISYNITPTNYQYLPMKLIVVKKSFTSNVIFNLDEKYDNYRYTVLYKSFNHDFFTQLQNFNDYKKIKELEDKKVIIFGDASSLIEPCNKYIITDRFIFKGEEFGSLNLRQYCVFNNGIYTKYKNYFLDKENENIVYLPFIDDPEYIVKAIITVS
jgi:hypothetical protein